MADIDRVYVEDGQFRGAISCAAALVRTGVADDPWWSIALSASSLTMRRRQRQLTRALRVAAADLAS